jgi:putative copper resistance protein D
MTQFIHIIPEWFELASLASCLGILACRLWVITPLAQTKFPPRDTLLVGLSRLFGISLALMLVSSVVNLMLRASEMSGYPLLSVFPSLPTVLFHTHLGRVWLMRMTAFALVTITLIPSRRRRSRVYPAFMLGIAVIASMTESASGHAADKGDFNIPEIMDWLHLFAASVWGGGLFALSLIILPNMVKQGDQSAKSIAGVAAKFSRIAGIAVFLIVFSALYQAWVYVGSFDALLKSPYGRTIIAKIVLFSLLLCLGAFNRYISVPRLQEWGGVSFDSRGVTNRIAGQFRARFLRNQNGRTVFVRFTRVVRIEALLMAGVFLCAAMLRHDVPARHLAHLEHAQVFTITGAETIVELKTNPEKIVAGVPVAMTIHIKDLDGGPLKGLVVSHERALHAFIIGKDLDFYGHIHPEDIGPVTDEMLKKAVFPLHFVFPKAGDYLVGLDFATTNNTISEFYNERLSLSVSGRPTMGKPKLDFARKKNFGAYQVTLSTFPKNVKAGEVTALRYTIEKNGKALTDLAPYLGAEMHLVVVSKDLRVFMHTHAATPGESHAHHDPLHAKLPEKFGPELEATVLFPDKGIYKLFSQVKHQGKVLLFDFTVNVQ